MKLNVNKALLTYTAIVLVTLGAVAVGYTVYELNRTEPETIEAIEVEAVEMPVEGVDYIRLDIADIPAEKLASACAELVVVEPTPEPTPTQAPAPSPAPAPTPTTE